MPKIRTHKGTKKRFRLSATAAGDNFLALPLDAQKILLIEPDQRNEQETERLRELRLAH